MESFIGKTAFITGGAGGIGLGMARAFGRAGMNVVLADIEEETAKAAAESLASQQIKAHPIHCDVTDRGSVRDAALEAVAAFGKVHVVCNNAGVAIGGPVGTMKPSDWDWIIDVNFKGVVYGVETFLPLIRSHGEGGHIVNTSSIAGLFKIPGSGAYCATKFAVVAMTEVWAMELAAEGIGMSVLCPGFTRTRIMQSVRNRQEKYGHQHVRDVPSTPVGNTVNNAVELGMDPDVVGERVLEAVRSDELYIIPDPRFVTYVEQRFAAIRAGFESSTSSRVLDAVKEWPPMPETSWT